MDSTSTRKPVSIVLVMLLALAHTSTAASASENVKVANNEANPVVAGIEGYPQPYGQYGGGYDYHKYKPAECPNPPKCRTQPSNPSNGFFRSCATVEVGGTCTGTCNNGYTGTLKATCIGADKWVLDNQCSPECTVQPDNPASGSFDCSLPVGVGATCNGACTTSGTLTATCIGPDTWTTCDKCTACVAAGESCPISCGEDDPTQCCDGQCDAGDCCVPDGMPCPIDPMLCCSGACTTDLTSSKSGRFVPTDTCGHGGGCFSGKTMVRILESPNPVAMEDLKTGQHVECLGTTEDFRLPTTTKYCQVLDWSIAKDVKEKQLRFHFTHPDNTPGSLTVTPTHLMMRLTTDNLAKGKAAERVHEMGRSATVPAKDVKIGDLMVVLANKSNPSAGFVPVTVTKVERVETQGKYIPLLETTYMLSDGVVTPLCKAYGKWIDLPADMDGAEVAAEMYLLAPVYKRRNQAAGISGKEAARLAKAGKAASTDALTILAALQPHLASGKVLSFTALKAWWEPHNKAWRADPSKVPSVEDVLAFLKTKSAWVQRKEQ